MANLAIKEGRTYLGIEFGSTRIKAVLLDDKNAPCARYEFERGKLSYHTKITYQSKMSRIVFNEITPSLEYELQTCNIAS